MSAGRKAWTPNDEEAFQRLARERDEIRGKNEAGVRLVAASVLRSMRASMAPPQPGLPPVAPPDETGALAAAMIAHVEAMRDALQPFDSGVRAAHDAPG